MATGTYLIVGGTSGIGLEVTRRLHAEKHQVIILSRNHRNLDDLPGVQHYSLDVLADPLILPPLPEVIDGVVYCPGTINLKPFRRLTESDFVHDFRINVTGAVKILQGVYDSLRRSDNASVVLFSTVAVQLGMSFHSSIAASKGAVEGLVRSLAAEWAPRIRVNAIAPSLTSTPLAAGLLSTEARQKASAELHPLKRIGQPEDIALAVLFLLRQDSSWITGQILHIDGGLSAVRPA